ncbi:MAG TPA: hypothetical protein PLN54_08380 [Flavobacteriales bacterium]|nr:hypothetical protein [Flavobacteriales bacterium]
MRVARHLRALALILVVGGAVVARAQGGIRLAPYHLDVGLDGIVDVGWGLGYDHDLSERTSFVVNAMYYDGTGDLELAYRSNFHFSSNNDRSSFYMGPDAAVRMNGVAGVGVPIGLHMGVRGGLRGFYMDLFAGVRHRIGDKDVKPGEYYPERSVPGLLFTCGLHCGVGWK